MKKCLVISCGRVTGNAIMNQLQKVLSGEVIVDTQYLKKNNNDDLYTLQYNYDCVLFTSTVAHHLFLKLGSIQVPYVVAGRVINHQNISALISIVAGTEVLLLNDSKESSLEAIKQLQDIGLDHIQYFPCYPGQKDERRLSLVITPGEPHLMPDYAERMIDIGTRVLDLKTIYTVKDVMGITQNIHDSLVISYIRDIIGITKSIDQSRRAENESKRVLETIFDTVDSGIAYLDNERRIVKVNSKFQQILGKNRRDLLSKPMTKIIPALTNEHFVGETFSTEINGDGYIMDIENIELNRETAYLMMVYPIQKIHQIDKKLAKNKLEIGITHLKSFEDYLTIHPKVKRSLKQAEKFAKNDATILIQGENGTGKEIIAQGIHRHSYRKSRPFIPINIAAISNNLLESELFGYEEGAFTGANKNGKQGLFEAADGGTLFIDEIGDAPLDIQVRLLRVLQEKKIRRIGGAEEISIDVRIIAATNKDLLTLVEQGVFREDLYFRLNILPFYTLPLRMRPEDINHLLNYFIELYFQDHPAPSLTSLFDEKTITYLNNYRWRGNVRELINLVEYLSYIYDGKPFAIDDLPEYFLTQSIENHHLSEEEIWVLKQVFYHPGSGRVTLTNHAKETSYPLGEGQIRRLLTTGQENGWLEQSQRGRGLTVTDKGQRILTKYI